MLMQYNILDSARCIRNVLSAFPWLATSLINLKLFLKTYFCNDVSSVAARHHFPVPSEYLLAMKHYSDWVCVGQKNAGAESPLLLPNLGLAVQWSRNKPWKILITFSLFAISQANSISILPSREVTCNA